MSNQSTSAATEGGAAATQWAWRASKSLGLSTGVPDFAAVQQHQEEEKPAALGATRICQYSPDGSTFAAASDESVRLLDTRQASSSQVKLDLPAAKVVDLQFSPRGTYLSTWERPAKLEDGSMARNLKIWNSNSGEEIASFERRSQEGW